MSSSLVAFNSVILTSFPSVGKPSTASLGVRYLDPTFFQTSVASVDSHLAHKARLNRRTFYGVGTIYLYEPGMAAH